MQPNQGRILERKVFFAGQTIFKEGDPGDRAYLIQEGKVEILRRNAAGQDHVIGTVGKGELFGEMALVDGRPRMAAARVVSDASVVIITQASFEEKLAKADPFIRGLLNIFVKHIRNLQR